MVYVTKGLTGKKSSIVRSDSNNDTQGYTGPTNTPHHHPQLPFGRPFIVRAPFSRTEQMHIPYKLCWFFLMVLLVLEPNKMQHTVRRPLHSHWA